MESKNTKDEQSEKQTNPPGYPLYPAGEDIYNQSEKVAEITTEDTISPLHSTADNPQNTQEKGTEGDSYGGDLDVPGSELDDAQEEIGNEDEENNYYSLGGDNHIDLEEDQGEE
ncbi:MAG TPA: hypothetical protein PLO67_05290 [Saprospiraceae bacterium]|nr:hypothetical protein [Saprospiraceae bacterium]